MRGMNSTEFVRTIRKNQWTGFPHKHQLGTIQCHSVFNSAMIYIMYQPSIACSEFYPVTVPLLTVHSSSWFCKQNHHISATINSFNGFLTYHGFHQGELPFTYSFSPILYLENSASIMHSSSAATLLFFFSWLLFQMLLLYQFFFHQWQYFQQ